MKSIGKSQPVLEVSNLQISFKTYMGVIQAVRGAGFHLREGETLAIVGESGCGKTVTAKAVMGLLPENSALINREEGKILYQGENLLDLDEKRMAALRGNQISMIFQDPMTSLNPTMRIGDQIAESVIIHQNAGKAEALKKAAEMLELVRIPNGKKRLRQYPFEFSGGMRQRAMIAIALACRPKILIADEPTTALDVTIQAQIMDLIAALKKELNMGVILVTHDLGVVASVADRILVMYAGKIVERGAVRELFYSPRHPYTSALLKSVPKTANRKDRALYSLHGSPPDLLNPPKGCAFAARCEYGMRICREYPPEVSAFGETQEAACWLYHENPDRAGVSFMEGGAANA
jgi:oligopeptide transport system ATP-binding protein